MTKYINNFSSVSAATEAQGLLSPNVTYVHEGEGEKILVLDCGDGDEVKITGSTIADLGMEKKPFVPEMVDLGLSSRTLWAKCNVGATTETGYGKYFAWGDAEGFEAGEVSGDMFYYQWYATRPGASLMGDIADNDATHNAALAAYGIGYTMPNKADFEDLLNGTNHEWTTVSGVNGCKFTSELPLS